MKKTELKNFRSDADKCSRAYIPNILLTVDRMYHDSDRVSVRFSDGQFYVGRAKIKVHSKVWGVRVTFDDGDTEWYTWRHMEHNFAHVPRE